jgi:hypothetical protein
MLAGINYIILVKIMKINHYIFFFLKKKQIILTDFDITILLLEKKLLYDFFCPFLLVKALIFCFGTKLS